MRRRILYIILVIVVVIIVVALLYWFFFQRNRGLGTAPSNGTAGSLPAVGTQGAPGTSNGAASGSSAGNIGIASAGEVASGTTRFGLISNEPTFAYFVDAKNNVTIVEPDGKIASILNGEPTFLNSIAINNIIAASFSFDGAEVVVNFGDPANPQTSLFDVAAKSWLPLTAGILSPAWSPADERIAYLKTNTDGSETLFTLDASKTNARPVALATLHLADVTLAWPSKNQIVIADKASSYETGSLVVFNIAEKTFAHPLDGAAGLDTIWSNNTSPDALVFTAGAAERGGTLALWNPAIGLTNLNFLTLPEKCVFNNEVVTSTAAALGASSTAASTANATTTVATPSLAFYCAIPEDQGTLAMQPLPDAYGQEALFTEDAFFKVRADTGATRNLFVPTIPIDGTGLRVFNNTLFFVNRYDQKLYALSLGG